MDKLGALKKKMIILAGVFLVILAVLGAAWYVLSSQESSSDKDLRKAQGETRKVSSSIDSLEVKYELARNSIERYGDLNKDLANGTLTISKEKVFDELKKLNLLHRISNLKLDIDNLSPLKQGDMPKLESLNTEFTNIEVEFDALSDLHSLAFLNGVEKTLPGYLNMSSLAISRERQITRDVLQAFANGEKPRVVSTKVNYIWYGITPVEKPKETEGVENAQ